MNVEWLVSYLFLALDCSLPIVEALAHAPLMLQRSNQKSIDVIFDYFITKAETKYGKLTPYGTSPRTRQIFSNYGRQGRTVHVQNLFIERYVEVSLLWHQPTSQFDFCRRVKDGQFSSKNEIILRFLFWKKQLDDQLAICPQVPQACSPYRGASVVSPNIE